MRRLATGLLVMMAVVFVAARLLQPHFTWLSFVAAFAEAAMVGALADWFAVTALFRAPLGLPIPHTAIIPRNKDRIGASIANFLEHNFMTTEVISVELGAIDFAGVAATWLAVPENSRSVSRQAVRLVPAVLRMFEDDDVGGFLQTRVAKLTASIRVGPFAAEILAVLIAEQHHHDLFDHLIRMVSRALEQHKPLIRLKIHERSPRWMPKTIDERFFNSLMEELQGFLDEMAVPDSDWRRRFQEALDELIGNLRSSPEFEAKIAGFIAQTVEHPLFRSWSESVWRDVKRRLLTDARADDSRAAARIEQGLCAFGAALAQNQAVRGKLNGWISGFATEVVVARRADIADLVRRVIQSWDAETVSRKFEMYVGRDLQYIRINGTLVGGLVGLLLHVISMAL
ncbi:MAG: DUF445 domain-containing protein [Herminiimonas sp.]|nr:DUF445 domain-containing protein [Herminiimonas sp.]